MPLREEKVFTDDEWVAAFSLILPPDQARKEGLAYASVPSITGFEDATPEELHASEANGPLSYDGDLLDLLSLVSDSCAERAWRLLGVTMEEGERRREVMRQRVDEARRFL
ncbi:MAG TPA: hypothetical protein VF541_18040 [Longimicrobium sp.]